MTHFLTRFSLYAVLTNEGRRPTGHRSTRVHAIVVHDFTATGTADVAVAVSVGSEDELAGIHAANEQLTVAQQRLRAVDFRWKNKRYEEKLVFIASKF